MANWQGNVDIEALSRFKSKQKPRRRYILPIAILAMLGISVIAIWNIYLKSSFTATISNIADFGGGGSSGSAGDIKFSVDFGDIMLDLDADELCKESFATISNPYENQEVTLHANVEKIDVQDNCIDYENDCSVSYHYNMGTIAINDTMVLLQGDSQMSAEVCCIEDACPQQINVEVTLT